MTIPTQPELTAARRLLQEDRAGFIAHAPKLGITKRIAGLVFGAPRSLRECLWIFDTFARNRKNGRTEALMEIARRCPKQATEPA